MKKKKVYRIPRFFIFSFNRTWKKSSSLDLIILVSPPCSFRCTLQCITDNLFSCFNKAKIDKYPISFNLFCAISQDSKGNSILRVTYWPRTRRRKRRRKKEEKKEKRKQDKKKWRGGRRRRLERRRKRRERRRRRWRW